MAALTVCTLTSSPSVSSVEIFPRLEEIVGRASIVARVRILNRNPITAGEGTDKIDCGYEYVATTLESLKGATGNISFISPVDNDFNGLNTEYLLVALSISPDDLEDALVGREPSFANRSEVRCRLAHSGLWTSNRQQSLIPFDSESAEGDEALLVSRPSVFAASEIDIIEVTRSGRSLGRLRWSDAAALLRAAIAYSEAH